MGKVSLYAYDDFLCWSNCAALSWNLGQILSSPLLENFVSKTARARLVGMLVSSSQKTPGLHMQSGLLFFANIGVCR